MKFEKILDASIPIVDTKMALIGGLVSAGVVGTILILAGGLSDYEAVDLMSELYPSIRFLTSGAMAASASILALMLTLLGVSGSTEKQLDDVHYRRVRQISLLTTLAFIMSTVLLLFLIFPVETSDALSPSWYSVIYYTLVTLCALLGGLLVSIILMIYNAVFDLVHFFAPGRDSYLVVDDSDEDESSRQDERSRHQESGERESPVDRQTG